MVREIVGDSSGRLGRALSRARPETTIRIQTSEAARGHHDVRLYYGNENRRDRRRPIWPRLSRTKSRVGSMAPMMHNEISSADAGTPPLSHAGRGWPRAAEFHCQTA